MSYMSLFDMVIVGIPVLAFGIWQLVSVNREIARDKAEPPPTLREPSDP